MRLKTRPRLQKGNCKDSLRELRHFPQWAMLSLIPFLIRRMKRKGINTILWMVIFAAATFCIIPVIFAVVIFSHLKSDRFLESLLWPLRLIFLASPWVALFLGWRGSLPGTRSLAVTERSPNTISRLLTLIVMVMLALFTLGAWVAFLPQPQRPNISIAFLGYTNDASGARLAKIAVTNLNPTTIFVYQPHLEIQAPADPRNYEDYFSGVNCSWNATLASGASGSFTIPPPTNQLPWRLSFYVYPDRGQSVKNSVKRLVGFSCLSVGLWPMFANILPLDGAFRHPYDMSGEWIKNGR